MASRIRTAQLLICGLLIGALIFTGFLRLADYQPSALSPYASLATPLYIGATILAAFLLIRFNVNFQRVGFAPKLRASHVLLAIIGVIILQTSAEFLAPVWEAAFGEQRNLERFSGIENSLPTFLFYLAFSWTFAAFGEEIAFRIVLMGGLKSALGGGTLAVIAALILQAVIFGLVHIYQGPAGFSGAAISGLVFGVLTIAGRGAIWPAALAHGANNTIGLTLLYFGVQ